MKIHAFTLRFSSNPANSGVLSVHKINQFIKSDYIITKISIINHTNNIKKATLKCIYLVNDSKYYLQAFTLKTDLLKKHSFSYNQRL